MSLLELFLAAPVWASAADIEHHAPSIHDIWFPLANFLIFAYIIKRFAVPRVREFLTSRREEVLATVKQAAERKARAETLVREYRERLARLDQEVESIRRLLQSDAEKEKSKLLSEIQALAAKIKEDARFLADQEVKVARQKIREEIAEKAEASARELIRRHISSADQARLAEEFIRNIGDLK
jgi:F-type H+-transporting ATPase subunit b